MPTSYIPYRLVHAHLSASRRATEGHTALQAPTARSFPPDDALYEPLHPEHAVSTVREPNTAIFARVVHNGYTLELSNLALSVDRSQASSSAVKPLTITFPDRLRTLDEGFIIPYQQDGRVYILLLSESDVVYRLKLYLVNVGGRYGLSVKGLEDWYEEWSVPEETLTACGGVGAWTVIDEDTLVLGAGDGGIVRLTRSGKWGRNAHWSASHQRPASKFRLPSIFSRSASDELVISTAQYDTSGPQSLIYTLSRDFRLRAWNPVTEVLLRTIDLRSNLSSSHDLVLRNAQSSSTAGSDSLLLPDTLDVPLVKVVPHPSATSRYSHLLVIFLAAPASSVSAGSFLVYRAVRAPNATADLVFAGSQDCSNSSVGCTIRGFTITPPTSADHMGTGWRLVVTWDKRGSIQGETICIDDILEFSAAYGTGESSTLTYDWQTVATNQAVVEGMDTAYFDRLISLNPPEPTEPHANDDIARTFVEHLFYPGRFASSDLDTALTEYTQQPRRRLVPHLSVSQSSLSGRFEATVGCDLEMSIDSQTGAPIVDAYREALKLDWLSIWARVKDLDTHSRWPLNTTVVDDQVMIYTRQGLSACVPEDVCGIVSRLGDLDDSRAVLGASSATFEHVYPSLATDEVRAGVVSIWTAARHITAQLDNANLAEAGPSALTALTDHLDESLATLETEPVEARAEALWDDFLESRMDEEDSTTVRRIMSDTASHLDALTDTLHLLGNAVDEEPDMSSERAFSGYGNALLTSTVASTVQTRYALARGALLVAIFYLVDSAGAADDEESEANVSIVNTASAMYHRYRVLKWLTERSGEEAGVRSRTGPRHTMETNALTKRTKDSLEDGLDVDGVDSTYSLVHCLLAQEQVTAPSTGFNLLFDASEAYLTQLDLVDPARPQLEPRGADIRLAHSVLQQRHTESAKRFTELYPLSAGTAYIRGRAFVELGELDPAFDLLKQAATGCRDGSLSCILPFASGQNAESEYFAHVSALYGDAGHDGPAIYFGQLALRSSTLPAPPKSLYTRVFLSNIALGNYEDAYSVLTATPSEELKGEFLGQLISVMCENNEVGRLNALGFLGFQPKVEELLSFKARNSDPLRYPNYYKVLYSWHISRGDYRSAGEIMYKQGRRFAEGTSSKVSAFELAAMQARSYLAAINALSLVDERNAWIALPAASRQDRVAKRRRVSSYIPQDQFSVEKRPVDIITLSDIQQDYTLVLSQLKLAGQIDDFRNYGSSTTPDEVVGLLVQRGSFDLALSTAASLDVDMTSLFQSLSRRCVELSRLSEIASDLSSAAFLHASPLTSRLRGSPSALSLRYLQTSLARYDSQKTQFRYRQVVADTLFEVNQDKKSGWEMPSWLVHMEMDRDPEAWISRAIKWGWVSEAVEWTRDLLRNATPPELLPPKKSNVVDIPYALIDRVLAAAGEGDEKDDGKVQAAVKGLREDVRRRLDGLENLK